MFRTLLASCAFVTLTYALASCSSGGHGSTSGTSTGTGGATGTGGGAGTGGALTITTSGSGGQDGGPSYLIYASTDNTLFSLDPTSPSLTVTALGKFDCIGPSGTPGQQSTAMTDLAVDKNQNIWGLSSFAVRPLTVDADAGTVHCGSETYVHVNDPNAPDSGGPPWIKFEALAFAPEGVIQPGVEVLIAGDTAGQLWAIEPPSTIVQHGQFGTVPADDGHGHNYLYPGGLWELSGDIIFLANHGSPVGFATVRDCPNPPANSGCNPIDTLVEIDMTALGQAGTQSVLKAIRGQVVKGAGCGDPSTGYGSMYGIASWNETVYGFSRSGNLVAISNVDGTACLVKSYPADLFSGAAVTTVAPVIPPPTQ